MLHDVGADVEEVSLVLDRNESALRAVVLGDLQGLRQRAQRLDVPLDAHVAEDKERGADRRLSERRVAGDEERHAHLGLDAIREQVDDLDVHVGVVEVTRDAQIALLRLNVAEGSLDRLLHRTGHAAREPHLPGARRDRDLEAVEAHRSVRRDARRVDRTGCQRVGGDEVASALLGHSDELLLAGLLQRVAEGRVVVLEGAHLLELLLHAAAAFERELENLGELVLRYLAMREEDLHHPRHRLTHSLAVAGVEVRAHGEVAVDDLGEVVLAHLAERFGEVVDNEPVVVREEVVAHLRDFPSREIEMHAVYKCHVISNDVWHWREQVAGLYHHIDGLVGIAEHCDARVAGDGLLPALESARLAVGFHRRDDLLGHLLKIRDLVEAYDIPDLHHALLAAVHVPEEVGDGGASRQQRGVRRNFLDDVALAGAARAELDEVVVSLGERDEPHQEEHL